MGNIVKVPKVEKNTVRQELNTDVPQLMMESHPGKTTVS